MDQTVKGEGGDTIIQNNLKCPNSDILPPAIALGMLPILRGNQNFIRNTLYRHAVLIDTLYRHFIKTLCRHLV